MSWLGDTVSEGLDYGRGLLFGTDQQVDSVSTLTPEQQAFLNNSVLPAAADAVGYAPAYDQSLLAGTRVDPSQFGNTLVGTDISALQGQFQQIQEQFGQAAANTLGGSERFSSGNSLIRGRLAGEAAARQSSILGSFINEQNQRATQANQFGQSLSAGIQQGNQSVQTNLATNLLNNQTGWNQSLMNSALGQATENIVTPGQQGLLNPQTIGMLGSVAIASSDERLKDEVGDVSTGLEEVLKMDGKKWFWKEGLTEDKSEQEGFMAQELEKIIPNAVKDKNGIKHVDIYALLPTMVNAIKELTAKVEALEAG